MTDQLAIFPAELTLDMRLGKHDLEDIVVTTRFSALMTKAEMAESLTNVSREVETAGEALYDLRAEVQEAANK